MHRRQVFLLGLLTAAALPIRGAYAQPNPDRAPISGLVRDENGVPLPGTAVTIRRQDDTGTFGFWGSEAVTDAQGQFKFPTAEEGRYYLNADKSGYAGRMNLDVQWKRGLPPLKVDLARLAELKVRVLQPDGSLLKTSAVYLKKSGEGEAGQTYTKMATSGAGIMNLSELVPATYNLVAVVPGVGTGDIQKLPIAYSPETKSVDLQLHPGGSIHVRASERATNGGPNRPLGGATLILSPAATPDGTPNRAPMDPGDNAASLAAKLDRAGIITPDGDGNITLSDIPLGRYNALLLMPGWPRPVEQLVNIEAGKTAEAEWVFEPKGSGKLTVEVQDKGGAAWANRDVVVRLQPLTSPEGQPPMDYIPGMQPFFPGSNMRRGTTDGQGKLTLYPMRLGKYRIWVAPRDATGGGRGNATDKEVEVTAEGAAATFKLQMALPAP